MKTCTKCGEVKALDCFSKDSHAKDTCKSRCRQCISTINKTWRDANLEKARSSASTWQKNNKQRVAACAKANYSKNADTAKRAAIRWQKANAERYRAIQIATSTRQRASLAPSYVARTLEISVAKLTPELLELKREQLAVRRLSREIKNTLKSLKEKA